MTKSSFVIILIMLFGFFFQPTQVLACGNNVNQKTMHLKVNKTEQKHHCTTKTEKTHSNDHDCNGECGNVLCPHATHFSILIAVNRENINNQLSFSVEKQKFYDINTNISSGFLSIWLLPKIS